MKSTILRVLCSGSSYLNPSDLIFDKHGFRGMIAAISVASGAFDLGGGNKLHQPERLQAGLPIWDARRPDHRSRRPVPDVAMGRVPRSGNARRTCARVESRAFSRGRLLRRAAASISWCMLGEATTAARRIVRPSGGNAWMGMGWTQRPGQSRQRCRCLMESSYLPVGS